MSDHATDTDRTRFATWVHAHSAAVRGFLWGLVRRHDLADDLLQETFRRAWQARQQYQEQGQERAYLLRIADRLAVDHLRQSARSRAVLAGAWEAGARNGESEGSPPQQAMLQEEAARLQQALAMLSETQRRVLLLRYYGSLEFHEIAEQLDLPLGTVLSHGHRGLEQLRKIWGTS